MKSVVGSGIVVVAGVLPKLFLVAIRSRRSVWPS